MKTRSLVLPERKEKETSVEYLERLKDLGFLFHGSSNPNLEILEPRYTYDPRSGENTDTAVFATTFLPWTVIFGLHGGHTGWKTIIRNEEVTAYIQLRFRGETEKQIGFVYVLPPSTFEKGVGQQYKSHEVVKPITKVEVTLRDYFDLCGKIEWV